MVGHPCQLDDPRRLDDDREKQVELADERPSGDAHPHPHAGRLTVATAIEDVDVSDDVRAPGRIAVDRGEQGKAVLKGCAHDLRRFSMELPWQRDT